MKYLNSRLSVTNRTFYPIFFKHYISLVLFTQKNAQSSTTKLRHSLHYVYTISIRRQFFVQHPQNKHDKKAHVENGKILFFNAYLIRMLCNINAASFYIYFILSENQSTVNTQQEVFNLMSERKYMMNRIRYMVHQKQRNC